MPVTLWWLKYGGLIELSDILLIFTVSDIQPIFYKKTLNAFSLHQAET
jgi:hypothetical protein